MKTQKIKTLFLDIGGVLLTNGWGKNSRKLAAEKFNLDYAEMDERHHLTFDTYELGKLTLDQYLNRVIFYEKKDFSKDDFRNFMFEQSKPYEETIAFFKEIKQTHRVKVVAVNNEGRELNEYRISKFNLHDLFDGFVSSCYVNFRKPDEDIFKMACNIAQAKPHEAIHIDDRQMFVEIARSVGLHGFHHTDLNSTKEKIAKLNF
ncbi:HAD family hydrolase [Ferruginibacter albus]|uniref:HAD family hydrolase n=1 Tax=Ferruginibacter albus TaxID=2875540 RepID=UPI001CC547F9|nr:HAD-IA family hydrolase [Ferruginibacter albus]UAY52212.1 HAD-IA family hydrolase [Ferruginibacter albus]